MNSDVQSNGNWDWVNIYIYIYILKENYHANLSISLVSTFANSLCQKIGGTSYSYVIIYNFDALA